MKNHGLDETHDPLIESWVGSAQADGADFPIQNLPFAIFRRRGLDEGFRGGIAIGIEIVDLRAAVAAGLFEGDSQTAATAAADATLNRLMALGPRFRAALRLRLFQILRRGSDHQAKVEACLVAQDKAEFALPATIGDFSDFYTSLSHATNVGKLFRPDNPLLPNFKWLPVAYHGRSSSIRVSGVSIPRPMGQMKSPDATEPHYGPSGRLDYEAELGILVGSGNELGEPVSADDAEQHLFGLCILNDWSARDIQAWEYQPLGPFLAKSFLTTLSPWVITLDALRPYRAPWTRSVNDPQPLPHLRANGAGTSGAIDVKLEVLLQTSRMRQDGQAPHRISVSGFTDAYWTIAQLVAHQTSNGCNLRPGDLLGSGTLSGPSSDSVGCLLELTRGGREPIQLSNGEKRTFIEDGDRVVMRAWCEAPGKVRIGFGECSTTILASSTRAQ
jgi:fumarylacetoacetase